MTTLRVIIDEMLSPNPGGLPRYTEELTAALITTAPRGCSVEGFVAASSEPDYQRIAERLPGLAHLHKSALARRELTAAWQHGFTRLPGNGMVHATSLFAPLARHDRLNDGDQIAVTIHDTIAWSHPEFADPPHRRVAQGDGQACPEVRGRHCCSEPHGGPTAHRRSSILVTGCVWSPVRPVLPCACPTMRTSAPSRWRFRGDTCWPSAVSSRVRGIDQLIRAFTHVPEDVTLLLAGHGATDEAIGTAAREAGLTEGRVRSPRDPQRPGTSR